jgi:primase-polymerase (primpol)-like protein
MFLWEIGKKGAILFIHGGGTAKTEQFDSSTAVEREKWSNLIHLRRWNGKNGAFWFIYGGGTRKMEQFDSSTAVEREKWSNLIHLRRWIGKNGAI